MSSLLFLALLVTVSLSDPIYFSYIDKISAWWPPTAIAQGIGVPTYASNNEYNVLSFAFITSKGTTDIATLWESPLTYFGSASGFGTTNDQIQRNLIGRYHDKGVKVMVSAFGGAEFPTTAGLNAATTCTSLANFVKNNHLDGLDIDWADNAAMVAGTGQQWLIDCTRAAREVLPKGSYYISHSPQAPYFDDTHYVNRGYARVNEEVGDMIDWYNVQYFNQGDTKYDSYQELYQSTSGVFAGTAVKQIHDRLNVPLEKIIVSKPVTQSDASNTGWVSPSSLGDWSARARNDFSWTSGIATWQYESDVNGQYVKDYKSALGAASSI